MRGTKPLEKIDPDLAVELYRHGAFGRYAPPAQLGPRFIPMQSCNATLPHRERMKRIAILARHRRLCQQGQRTKEIRVRMALGASSWLVRRGVLSRTLRLALAGVTLGTFGSFVMSRWIQSLRFGTTAVDPAVFSGVSLLLVWWRWLPLMFPLDEPLASIRCRRCALNSARSHLENLQSPNLLTIAPLGH